MATFPKVAELQRLLKTSGRLYLAETSNKDKVWEIGDYSNAKVTMNPEDSKVPNNRTVSGGSSAIYSRVQDVKVSIEGFNFNGTMLQQIFGATVKDVTSASLTTIKKAFSGGLLLLNQGTKVGGEVVSGIFDPTAAVTVKSSDDVTTFVAGTDYAVENDGIRIIVGGAIATLDVAGAGTEVKVTWSNRAAINAQALTNLGREYVVVFKSEDAYNQNKAFEIKMFKVRLAPTKDFMLNDEKDMKKATLEGEALPDFTIPYSTETSQFFEINMVG